MKNIKLVIFDWGRTLYNPETKDLFPSVIQLLEYLSEKYQLAIAALATDGDLERRYKVIKENNLEKYFKLIKFSVDDKDFLYGQIKNELKIQPENIVIVDDRTIRGIKWGNNHGCATIWIKGGKFSEELPNAETGEPIHTISNIIELKSLL